MKCKKKPTFSVPLRKSSRLRHTEDAQKAADEQETETSNKENSSPSIDPEKQEQEVNTEEASTSKESDNDAGLNSIKEGEDEGAEGGSRDIDDVPMPEVEVDPQAEAEKAAEEEKERARQVLAKRCADTRRALSGGMTKEEWREWQWNEATARNEARARQQIASGEVAYFRPKPKVNTENMTEDQLRRHRARQRNRKLEALLAYYDTEEKLITAYLEIKISLQKEDPQKDKVIRILKAVNNLYVPQYMILNNPEMMEVLLKLRRYRRDARIRHMATEVYNKFRCLFLVPERETFVQHFRRQVRLMNMYYE